MKNIELKFMRYKQGFKIDLDFINKVYYKFLDFISFGFISNLNNVISDSHRDNIKLLELVDSFINKLDDIDETLIKHRELSKNLQLDNDKLKIENERLIIVIKALENKNVSYAKKHDDIDAWLMRNTIKKYEPYKENDN